MNFPVSQTNRQLNTLPFDPQLTPGARNAVSVCLRIQPSEKVTVITDEATREIAASLVHELEVLGASYKAWILEDLAPRPLTDLPPEIMDDLETRWGGQGARCRPGGKLYKPMSKVPPGILLLGTPAPHIGAGPVHVR